MEGSPPLSTVQHVPRVSNQPTKAKQRPAKTAKDRVVGSRVVSVVVDLEFVIPDRFSEDASGNQAGASASCQGHNKLGGCSCATGGLLPWIRLIISNSLTWPYVGYPDCTLGSTPSCK